jgi:enoyl-CoA hydratase/carnithine racemase
MPAELMTRREDETLVLTLCDPATRNALAPQVYVAAVEALNSADADPSIRCVVLTGHGQHFCAGGDLHRLDAARRVGAPDQARTIDSLGAWIEALRALPKPVIAAVEGYAAGAGCSLALACDLIVAAEDAKFILSYGRAGLSPDGGASWHLSRWLPRAAALQMLWMPEPMPAPRWLELGLVNAVVDSGHALVEALRMAERLCAMAPNAVASAKELVNGAASRSLSEQLALERDHFVVNLLHPNGGEGIAAFLEKRAPRFR